MNIILKVNFFASAYMLQFVDLSGNVVAQFFSLGITMLILVLINSSLYSLFASSINHMIQSDSMQRWVKSSGAAALIGAGVITASMERTQ